MDQEALKEGLEGLERKILFLLKERKALQKELEQAQAELKTLGEEISRKDRLIKELKANTNVEQMANRVHNADKQQEVEELKKALNEYIMELDQCIAHLNA